MNNNKFSMLLMALLCLSLSESLGSETPEFLSFSASQRSLQPPLSIAEKIAQIRENLDDCRTQLRDLKRQWTFYDSTWEILDKLQNEKNDIIFAPYTQNLCNAHEKILREIIYLNEEIEKLEEKKASLEKIKTNLNIGVDSLINIPST